MRGGGDVNIKIILAFKCNRGITFPITCTKRKPLNLLYPGFYCIFMALSIMSWELYADIITLIFYSADIGIHIILTS